MGLDYLKIKGANGGHDLDDNALMQENKDAMCGGPTCIFCGKELPCYVNVLPNASITSKKLAEMLSDINHSGVFGQQLGQLKMGTTVKLNYRSQSTIMIQNTPGLCALVCHMERTFGRLQIHPNFMVYLKWG
jgi:hypothetical protein